MQAAAGGLSHTDETAFNCIAALFKYEITQRQLTGRIDNHFWLDISENVGKVRSTAGTKLKFQVSEGHFISYVDPLPKPLVVPFRQATNLKTLTAYKFSFDVGGNARELNERELVGHLLDLCGS